MAAKRGRGARLKGANFERQLAKLLTDSTNIEFKRGLGQTRRGAAEVPDVYSDEVEEIHIEAKRQKRCSIRSAMEQALRDRASEVKMPVVITKDDHNPIYVTMLFEDWLQFFNAYLDNRK